MTSQFKEKAVRLGKLMNGKSKEQFTQLLPNLTIPLLKVETMRLYIPSQRRTKNSRKHLNSLQLPASIAVTGLYGKI